MSGLYELMKAKFENGEMPFDVPLSRDELASLPWYYTVELEPGRFTDGETYSNVALTRDLVARTGVEDRTCLDIGTMEGLIPTLMARRGARHVVAYDRMQTFSPRIDTVKSAYGVDFDVVMGGSIASLRSRLGGKAPFDVVVISGVIYHQMDPFAGLAAARALVRDGGIMIVETSAAVSSSMSALFNANGKFGVHAYYLICLPALDYMLRFLRLRILDCAHIPSHQVDDVHVCRVAVACRAEPQGIGNPDDEFVRGTFLTETDVKEFIDWKGLRNSFPPVDYKPANERNMLHSGFDSVDVYASVVNKPPFAYEPKKAILHLQDIY